MATIANERRLLTVGDVAARLNCSETTVRRPIERGLPALRLGHRGTSIRVDPHELERWLYASRVAGRSWTRGRGVSVVSLTDQFREAEIRDKLERGEQLTEREKRFLEELELRAGSRV